MLNLCVSTKKKKKNIAYQYKESNTHTKKIEWKYIIVQNNHRFGYKKQT
jgi:hypothetical protein